MCSTVAKTIDDLVKKVDFSMISTREHQGLKQAAKPNCQPMFAAVKAAVINGRDPNSGQTPTP